MAALGALLLLPMVGCNSGNSDSDLHDTGGTARDTNSTQSVQDGGFMASDALPPAREELMGQQMKKKLKEEQNINLLPENEKFKGVHSYVETLGKKAVENGREDRYFDGQLFRQHDEFGRLQPDRLQLPRHRRAKYRQRLRHGRR
jgi:hypothetical protein